MHICMFEIFKNQKVIIISIGERLQKNIYIQICVTPFIHRVINTLRLRVRNPHINAWSIPVLLFILAWQTLIWASVQRIHRIQRIQPPYRTISSCCCSLASRRLEALASHHWPSWNAETLKPGAAVSAQSLNAAHRLRWRYRTSRLQFQFPLMPINTQLPQVWTDTAYKPTSDPYYDLVILLLLVSFWVKWLYYITYILSIHLSYQCVVNRSRIADVLSFSMDLLREDFSLKWSWFIFYHVFSRLLTLDFLL